MKLKKITLLISFLFLSIIVSPVYSQTKEIDKQEKRQEKKKGNQADAEKELSKRHLSIQQKETRKRIKRSLKEAERRKKGKNPNPWYERIFRKGLKTKRAKKT